MFKNLGPVIVNFKDMQQTNQNQRMDSNTNKSNHSLENLQESLSDSMEEKLLKSRTKTLAEMKNQMETLNKEIRKTEQLRAQFLSNVSHEIKTPLNSILSATLLLQQKTLDSESAELVNTIHHSGQYLFSLLNDVLDYYKIAAHQLTLDHIRFGLRNEIQEVIDIFEDKAHKKGLEFKVTFHPGLPETLTGDPTRLKQILTHLLDNAVKFTPSGGEIHLMVTPVSFQNGKHTLRFTVQDTGIGIKKEYQEQIWEKFTMADMSLTRENQGTGFGLALSRRLCHLLGGEMYLESEPSKGSIFSFTVKMEQGPVKNHKNKSTSGILHILLVEDNQINQKLTQKILQKQGFNVDVADNGKIAVEKFRHTHYDLIFMDIQMPVMDGLQAARAIRKIEQEQLRHGDRVKIIALTANSHENDKADCLDAGMDDYINKPFNINKFPLILNNYR